MSGPDPLSLFFLRGWGSKLTPSQKAVPRHAREFGCERYAQLGVYVPVELRKDYCTGVKLGLRYRLVSPSPVHPKETVAGEGPSGRTTVFCVSPLHRYSMKQKRSERASWGLFLL